MRLQHSLSLCLSFLLFALCSLTHAADPALNGIAVHSELGKEQFIGALYSVPSDNVEALTSSTQPMKMELKIVAAEGLTTRRFSRLWIEGMAINNASGLLTEQADNMVKFDGLFKGRFVQNDDIVFSYEPTKGVNILVNDVLLGNIPSEKFFGMLLRTWIGRVPLSSDYKEGILKVGKVSADLKSRFDKIKPSASRATEVAAWVKGSKAAADLAAADKESKSASSQSSSTENTKQLAAQKAEAAKEAAAREAARLAAQKAAAEEDEKPALTAQTLLARQFYVSDLLKKIGKNTRYPKRALERNQAGSVRITVVINRQGAVLSSSLLDGSQYQSLNDAALDAISQSAPFPPMPDAITGANFEFTVPTTFALPK
jgi:protein TonB